MISLDSVESSILELEQKDTSFTNCERLAWLYIVRDHLRGYSVATGEPLDISGESEFLKAVNGKNADAAWKIMDELAEDIKLLHPKMYDKLLEKINEI